MKIGFIGLGIMGRPMALNLKNAGHELIVPERSSLTDEIRTAAKVVATPKAVAAESEVLILMVPDTPDVEAVLFGKDGAAEGLQKGSLVIDMSSISPIETKDYARRVNEKGCDYLDAPVSGGEVGAKQATLTIMVGGPDAAFARAKPLFELMGKNITHVGSEAGAGQICKVANQIIVALNIQAVSEALVFASKAGRRSCQSAAGADGWLRVVAHSGSACRTHAQRHVQPRLQDQAAPEGPEFSTVFSQGTEPVAAEHRGRPADVLLLHRPWRGGTGPLRLDTGDRRAGGA